MIYSGVGLAVKIDEGELLGFMASQGLYILSLQVSTNMSK